MKNFSLIEGDEVCIVTPVGVINITVVEEPCVTGWQRVVRFVTTHNQSNVQAVSKMYGHLGGIEREEN